MTIHVNQPKWSIQSLELLWYLSLSAIVFNEQFLYIPALAKCYKKSTTTLINKYHCKFRSSSLTIFWLNYLTYIQEKLTLTLYCSLSMWWSSCFIENFGIFWVKTINLRFYLFNACFTFWLHGLAHFKTFFGELYFGFCFCHFYNCLVSVKKVI